MTHATHISSSDESQQKPLGFPAGKHRALAGEYIYMLSKNYYQVDFLWPLVFQANKQNIKSHICYGSTNFVYPSV